MRRVKFAIELDKRPLMGNYAQVMGCIDGIINYCVQGILLLFKVCVAKILVWILKYRKFHSIDSN